MTRATARHAAAQPSLLRYELVRLRKHVEWARTQGLRRLIEEDELDPIARARASSRRVAWRIAHGVRPGSALAVYVVGAQRSGTNMLVRALARSPEVEVHNENDRRAFTRFRLRADADIAAIVAHSRHNVVLFKPLCDSGRVAELLDDVTPAHHARAVWVYRDPDERARSAVAKFGDRNLQALRDIAAGDESGWQAQGMSAGTRRVVAQFDYDAMSPETASLLFWWVRNRLFFDHALDRRPDVRLVCYDGLVAAPVETLRPLFDWLGVTWSDRYVADVAPRSAPSRPQLATDPRVRALVTDLAARLAACLPLPPP